MLRPAKIIPITLEKILIIFLLIIFSNLEVIKKIMKVKNITNIKDDIPII